MFNSAMQIPPQNPYMGQTLPDDTDRISGMMGFDVNGYVFGNQNINNQTQPIQNANPLPQNGNCAQNPASNAHEAKKGILLLGILLGSAALLLRNRIHLPSTDSLRSLGTSISNGFNAVRTRVSDFVQSLRRTSP